MSVAPVLAPATRTDSQKTGLAVVPTPAPARGFFWIAVASGLVVASAVGTSFHLNTQMAQGAYDLKNIRVELSEATAREATLEQEIISVSTPEKLRATASEFGMVPVQSVAYLDLTTGVISNPQE
ncbi:MAG: hypothetical protein Q4E03_03525 [Trueperella sp.]|nr:hypothetical protein [Trueperella sp.]